MSLNGIEGRLTDGTCIAGILIAGIWFAGISTIGIWMDRTSIVGISIARMRIAFIRGILNCIPGPAICTKLASLIRHRAPRS
jgi:hypothetical protein